VWLVVVDSLREHLLSAPVLVPAPNQDGPFSRPTSVATATSRNSIQYYHKYHKSGEWSGSSPRSEDKKLLFLKA
jgi:hypothetical protein